MTARGTLEEALAAQARRDLARLALAVAAVTALSLREAPGLLPQGLAALAVLLGGASAERFRPRLAGRLVLLAAAGAFAWLPGGAPPAILARFLSALTAASLLRPKAPREHGFVVLLLLLETALAAVLSLHWGAAPAGVLLAVLFHRAIGSWHRQRSAARAAAAGGPLVRAEDPRRLRRSADAAAVLALVLAAPIFLVLPRTDVPILRLPGMEGRTEPGVPEEVRLGRLGSVADADQVIGRVAPQDAAARDAPTYFRSVVLDRFDGTRWLPSEALPSARARYDAGGGTLHLGPPAEDAPEWLFVMDAAAVPRLPLPERAARVRFVDPVPYDARADAAGTVRPAMGRPTARWVYAASAARPAPDTAAPPGPSAATRATGPDALRRELGPAVDAVLARVPPAAVRERARRLEAWVRSAASYDLLGGPGGDDPVGDFLFRAKRGHCEHFASALAMALREAGIPARFVAGYHALRWNDVGGFWVLRRRDAHAWVEAWIPGEGWARFDATPEAVREADPYAGFAGFFARLRDAAAFAWSRSVLEYDRDAQRGAVEALRDLVAAAAPTARRAATAAAVAVGAGGVAVLAAAAWRRRRRARLLVAAAEGGGFYADALRLLRRRGLRRGGAETPHELAVRARAHLPEGAARALRALTEAHVRLVYGAGSPPDPAAVRGWMAHLEAREARFGRDLPRVEWTDGLGVPTLRAVPTEVRTDGSQPPNPQEGEPRSPTV